MQCSVRTIRLGSRLTSIDGRKISAKDILVGGNVAVPAAVGVLHNVIAAAEG